MKTPLLSVCLITYNHEKFIRQAIDGVLMQKVDFEWELIIAEDCSTDSTRAIVLEYKEKYPDFIKLILQEKNVGAAKNWMDLITTPKSKYIAYFEGDDYWTDPLKLQKQVDFLEANPDYVLCFHPISVLKTNGDIVDDFITKVPENYETIETLARLGNYIHTPSVVFRNVIKEFPFEFSQSPIGDYFLYMLLAEHGKLKYLEDNMAVYRYGVGIFPSLDNINARIVSNQFYSCLLSYLVDENLKKIILQRKFFALDGFNKAMQYHYTLNKYISTKKKYVDILKIIIMKLIKYNKSSV